MSQQCSISLINIITRSLSLLTVKFCLFDSQNKIHICFKNLTHLSTNNIKMIPITIILYNSQITICTLVLNLKLTHSFYTYSFDGYFIRDFFVDIFLLKFRCTWTSWCVLQTSVVTLNIHRLYNNSFYK